MPPSPPMMAHLLSLGTQSKDAARAASKTERAARVPHLQRRESERENVEDDWKEVSSLHI